MEKIAYIDRFATARCIECSRESWKSKKFATTGMNTEVSVNPSIEVDLRIFSGINGTHAMHCGHAPPSTSPNYNGRMTRMRSSALQRPVGPPGPPGPPPAIIHCGSLRKEIADPSLPSIQVSNVKSIASGNDIDHGRSRDHSPSSHLSSSPGPNIEPPPPPPVVFTTFQQGTQITYPRMSTVLHSEIPYDRPPPLHTPPLRPHANGTRTPPPAPPPMHVNSSEPVPVPHGHIVHPMGLKEESTDGNPTVYVLPNDYDVNSGVEPHFPTYGPVHEDMHHVRKPPIGEPMEVIKETGKSGRRIKPDPSAGYALPTQVSLGDSDADQAPNGSPHRSGSASPGSGNEETGSPGNSEGGSTQRLYCKICHKVFPTKSLLYKHLRGHSSDEKPYKCQECGQGFTLSSNLRQHRIIHRGYKPFQCEFCGKKFMRSNVYKQHRRIHTGEEMHKCSLCPSEFLQKYALIKHMKKQHDVDTGDNI